jgi:hypothetical protein
MPKTPKRHKHSVNAALKIDITLTLDECDLIDVAKSRIGR